MDSQAWWSVAQNVALVLAGAVGTWTVGALTRRSERRYEMRTRWDPLRRDLFVQVLTILDAAERSIQCLGVLSQAATRDEDAIAAQVRNLRQAHQHLLDINPQLRLEFNSVFVGVSACRNTIELQLYDTDRQHSVEYVDARRNVERAMRKQLDLPDLKPARWYDRARRWFRRTILRKKENLMIISGV